MTVSPEIGAIAAVPETVAVVVASYTLLLPVNPVTGNARAVMVPVVEVGGEAAIW